MLRSRALGLTLTLLLWQVGHATAQVLLLPPRPPDALGGAAFATDIATLALRPREERIFAEVSRGNVPTWLRQLVRVATKVSNEKQHFTIAFWATPDYLAVGSDTDYFLMPMSPQLAQRIADLTHTSLPTPRMVDAIWHAAIVRLGPDSIAPSAAMITVPVFTDHHRLVRARRDRHPAPLGALVAGHKKDVVLSGRLDTLVNRVAIYGWHKPDGQPIQPLNTWHTTEHVDYSHGIRLVSRQVVVNGVTHDLVELLANPALAWLLSDDGVARPYRITQ